MTTIKRFDDSNAVRFVTFSCYHHFSLFKTSESKDIFIRILDNLRNKHNYKLYGYVVMTNHVHLVLMPSQSHKLGLFIGALKSISAREILKLWRTNNIDIFNKLIVTKDGKTRYAFWQRRYYDHNCRDMEAIIEKINYCHNNPVKKGLVEDIADWRWSSYRWFNGMDNVAIKMDALEL